MSAKFATVSSTQKSSRHQAAKGTHSSFRFKVRIRYVAVIVVLFWGSYEYLHVQKAQYQKLQEQETQLNVQLQSMKVKQDDLERQAKELNNDAYIARYASEHFNLVLPGQVSFVVQH